MSATTTDSVLSPRTRWTIVELLSASISDIYQGYPPGTSVIAFVLKGPRNIDLPGGSVSYSVA